MNASQERNRETEQAFVIAQALALISTGSELEQAKAWAKQSAAELDPESFERCKREAAKRAERYAAARAAALADLLAPLPPAPQ